MCAPVSQSGVTRRTTIAHKDRGAEAVEKFVKVSRVKVQSKGWAVAL
ncbi:hypothetical protein N601_30950 [Rhodococcus erythropolis DN1]|nr:hypothetical protein N601_30950 [Rhodococcus erythropolis DN1]